MSNSKKKSLLETAGVDVNDKHFKLLSHGKKMQEEAIKPHFDVDKGGASHQADLLHLPKDNGYEYALVVTDLATRAIDSVPIKTRDAKTVLAALQKIYQRQYLKIPTDEISTDDGSEFGGVFHKWIVDHGLHHKIGLPNRHTQSAMIEAANKQIGEVLNTKMNLRELKSGKPNTEWTSDLEDLIPKLNEYRKRKPEAIDIDDVGMIDIDPSKLLDKGQAVRVMLDQSFDAGEAKKLKGRRIGDVIFSPDIHYIKNVFINPDQPVRYQVSDIGNASYTRNQLLLVDAKELKEENQKNKQHGKYEVEKFVDKRTVKGKVEYKVKWEGYDKPHEITWEPYNRLVQDLGINHVNAFIKQMRK